MDQVSAEQAEVICMQGWLQAGSVNVSLILGCSAVYDDRLIKRDRILLRPVACRDLRYKIFSVCFQSHPQSSTASYTLKMTVPQGLLSDKDYVCFQSHPQSSSHHPTQLKMTVLQGFLSNLMHIPSSALYPALLSLSDVI